MKQTEQYLELRNQNLKRSAIADIMGLTENQLGHFITRNGLSVPRATVDPTIFSTFNEESCYWGGFLAADGCITSGTLKVCLGYDDLSHLEKYKKFTKSTHKITINTEKYYRCEISFKNKNIADDLEKYYNIVPRKSLIYKLPENIPENMFRHYLRGYFDGDGCICESFSNVNSKTATLYTTISGSKFLLEELYKYLEYKLGISGTLQEKTNHSCAKYCSNASKVLLDYMYKDCTIYLDRKYDLYNKVQNNRLTR